MGVEKEKAKLIKDALKIVDEVAKLDLEEIEDSGNFDDLRFLIKDSKNLTRNRLWKLK
jgi:hypothetical protein